MENASKALIIAAAILIAILLISVGVYVVGVAQEQINNSDMSSIELETFNQKFTKYLGNQKGSAIRTMVQEAMAYNNSDQASDETMISITGLVTLSAAANVQPNYDNNFKSTKTYTVTITYNKGRVKTITVEAANAQNP